MICSPFCENYGDDGKIDGVDGADIEYQVRSVGLRVFFGNSVKIVDDWRTQQKFI